MKTNTFILIFIAVMLLTSTLHAQAGEYGFQFLKIPVSPELAATANTGDMHYNSPLGIFHHPAALNWTRGSSIAASQTNWLVGTNMYNLAWRNIMLNQSIGLGFVYMDNGKFDRRTENGDPIGAYYPMDLKVTGNYAFKLMPNMLLGANLNLIYEKIDNSSALGFAADLGYAFLTPITNTAFDFAIKNIGFSSKMDKETIDLPFSVEAGLTTGFDLNVFGIYPSAKLVYLRDHANLLPSIGVQMSVHEIFFIRCGYKFNYNEEDFSAGFGVNYMNFKVDYAFLNNNLENTHLFGLGWLF